MRYPQLVDRVVLEEDVEVRESVSEQLDLLRGVPDVCERAVDDLDDFDRSGDEVEGVTDAEGAHPWR